jgi:hypothetical protein
MKLFEQLEHAMSECRKCAALLSDRHVNPITQFNGAK